MPLMKNRQELFIAAYLKTLNGAESARIAGYAIKHANITGCRLLAKSTVKAAIEKGMKLREQQLGVEANEVVKALHDIAFMDDPASCKFKTTTFDKLKALELLGKHLNMFVEHVDLTQKTISINVTIDNLDDDF